MSVPMAYVGVVLIWGTTPLAIQWSSQSGFVLGLALRMLIGAALALAVIALLRERLPWHRAAIQTYAAVAVAVYGAMFCVYWASQFIPSGWISVLFGLSPIATGLLAAGLLGERALTPPRLLGMLLALAGLAVVFAAGQRLGPEAHWGVIGMLGSVVLHAVSTVWVKRIDAGISGMSTTAGGLLFAAPAFALTWLLVQPTLPEAVPLRTGLAILYLAAFGSVLGFWLFFYVLRRLEAARVSLIAFVTPVIALLLGHALNGEPVEPRVYLGAALILGGLATYQWGVMRRA